MGVTYLGLECVEGTVGTGKLGREYVDGCIGTGTLGRESGNGGMGIGMWCLKQLNNMSYWCPIFDSCGDFAIVLGLYRLCCILGLCQQYFCRILLIGVCVSAVVCCVCHCFILFGGFSMPYGLLFDCYVCMVKAESQLLLFCQS
mgnify:CR=1 FL=1